MFATDRRINSQLRQTGAASLIVVMVLFFIMSMVAAYTSRNLIFEQRTSTNQYRSTQALEAADAGLEWALSMLNAGRVNDSCVPTAVDSNATFKTFRQRYLVVDSSTGNITFTPVSGGGSAQARCVFDGTAANRDDWKWSCSCPQTNTTNTFISSPSDSSFIVVMRRTGTLTARTDLFYLQSNSCTALNNNCLNFNVDRGGTGDGVASVRTIVALRGALTRVPVAPLNLGGTLRPLPSGVVLTLINADTTANGITLHSGGANNAGTNLVLSGLPGTPAASTAITGDSALTPVAESGFTAADRKFAGYFGMPPLTYQGQPAMVRVDCSSGCQASSMLVDALLRNPGRPIWVTGAGTLNLDVSIGSISAPALLIVDGDITFGSGVAFTGLIYGRKASWNWTASGTGPTIRGAAIAEGDLQFVGAANSTVQYDAAVLRTLRVSYGSFVRVPGSWQDFQ